MSKIVRPIATENVFLGQPITVSLPRNYAYRDIKLRLAGSITISGGSASGTPYVGAPAQLITSIEVRRGGKDTIFSMSGEDLYLHNSLMYGVDPQNATLADGDAQTNTAVNVELTIPFENLLGAKPFDTLLQSVGLSSLDLIINIASAASVVVDGGDRTIAVGSTNFSLDISSTEEDNTQSFVFGDIRQYVAQNVNVAGASQNFQIKPINTGNFYKGFIIIAKDTNVAGELTNGIINNIRLKSGTISFFDQDSLQTQADNKVKLHLSSTKAGLYYIDLMPDGRLNQTLDVSRASGRESLEFELDVNAPGATGTIRVLAQEYVKPVVVEKEKTSNQ